MTTPHSALQREQQELMRRAARDFVEEHFTLGSPDVHQQRIGELLAAETA